MAFQNNCFKTLRRIVNRFATAAELEIDSAGSFDSVVKALLLGVDRLDLMVPPADIGGDWAASRRLESLRAALVVVLTEAGAVLSAATLVVVDGLVTAVAAAGLASGSINTTSSTE